MDKQQIPNQILVSVKQLKKEVAQHFNIKNVIIFGSQAKATTHDFSDIDVCIVSDEFDTEHYEEQTMLVDKISLAIDDRIETHLMQTDEYNNKYYTLAQEVKKYGISV